MLMNKKGFTLIELLAVITIMAILMIIAIPNIVGIVDRSRKEMYVADAKELISIAKYKYKLDSSWNNNTFLGSSLTSNAYVVSAETLGFESTKDAYGDDYVLAKAQVEITVNANSETYAVKLCTLKRGITSSTTSSCTGYISESDLSIQRVKKF